MQGGSTRMKDHDRVTSLLDEVVGLRRPGRLQYLSESQSALYLHTIALTSRIGSILVTRINPLRNEMRSILISGDRP